MVSAISAQRLFLNRYRDSAKAKFSLDTILRSVPAKSNSQTKYKQAAAHFFPFSIHKPPASFRFTLVKHALAVTVEPFKFSSRQGGVAYE
jgi:hypothetical protein